MTTPARVPEHLRTDSGLDEHDLQVVAQLLEAFSPVGDLPPRLAVLGGGAVPASPSGHDAPTTDRGVSLPAGPTRPRSRRSRVARTAGALTAVAAGVTAVASLTLSADPQGPATGAPPAGSPGVAAPAQEQIEEVAGRECALALARTTSARPGALPAGLTHVRAYDDRAVAVYVDGVWSVVCGLQRQDDTWRPTVIDPLRLTDLYPKDANRLKNTPGRKVEFVRLRQDITFPDGPVYEVSVVRLGAGQRRAAQLAMVGSAGQVIHGSTGKGLVAFTMPGGRTGTWDIVPVVDGVAQRPPTPTNGTQLLDGETEDGDGQLTPPTACADPEQRAELGTRCTDYLRPRPPGAAPRPTPGVVVPQRGVSVAVLPDNGKQGQVSKINPSESGKP